MQVNSKFFISSIFKSLKVGSKRVFVIFIAIFIGTAVSSGFLGIYFDIDTKMSKELKAYGANFIMTPTNSNFMEFKKYQNALEKIDKNTLLGQTPYLYGYYSFGIGNGIIAGVDFAGLKKTKPFLEIRKGSMNLSDFSKNSAFLGLNLAKSLEAKINQTITITNPKNLISKNVIVKGIFYGGDESDELMFVNISLAQELEGKNIINYANAVINLDFDAILNLSKNLSSDEINAKPIAQISLSEGAVLEKIKGLMALIGVVILIISSTSVNTTLSSIIFSRKKEIALNLALGATKKDIIKLFGSEIAIITIFSAILGAFSGYILAQILGMMIFKASIDFRVLSVVIAVLISLFCSFVAAFYPIKKAIKINLADTLRGE
ncbi:ABC transporter permease [Campylobacter corcagiensis]|uniref:ABC transporter permease n=1 Tax=Campylobacter corcagiensis TaxID=1448857 RepID=A0A7M1LI13_9BACT|nr:FtsX-like permease family protein [Campylobacter corcagiensis]QKF64700.1 ferrirhodotorulic acid ABC transporter, permease protein [Campylobacter corcagiensis]QOQ87135.1 ABC transporter permease [Campylobacter corcagiensis]